MSYQVLARKYRPKSFQTLVGQEHVVRALTHALDQQRLHHAYLFTGTRGVGKTTLSRILAKSLNCETGITANPCGTCEACTAIDAGRFVDYIEMDAASNRGVDEMAQLLEQAVYAPSNARFKVYMIDEVHMLTNHAFNSMLKTLEEPPEHIKFILATTDPQKIPVTVLSRCLQFNLKQMPPGHIIGHLDHILNAEQIEFETPALRLLAQGAHGSMRDALSLTDQAIAYAAGKVTLEAVQGMLGALDQSFLIRLLDALAAQDGAGLMSVADDMATRSLSYHAALQDLATLLHRVALAQTVPAALAEDLPDREDIMRLAGLFDAEEIQLFYQIAVHGRSELGLAPDEFAGFSMTLLRMLAFRPGMGGGDKRVQGNPTSAPGRPVGRPATTGAAAVNPNTASAVASGPVVGVTAQAVHAVPQPAAQAATTLSATPAARLVAPSTVAVTSAPVAPPTSAPNKTVAMSPSRAALEIARSLGKGNKGSGSAARVLQADATPVEVVQTTAADTSALSAPSAARVSSAPEQIFVPGAAPASPVNSMGGPPEPPPFDDEYQQQTPPPWEQDSASSVQIAAGTRSEESQTPTRRAAVVTEPVAPYEPKPVPELEWDGNWPVLAASLPVRGVAQQLAQQSELLSCVIEHDAALFEIRVAVETLLSSGSVDKLTAALSERFGRTVRVTPKLGAVVHTANAAAVADREERQRQAEHTMESDPFVQAVMREFGAAIVPGSVRPM